MDGQDRFAVVTGASQGLGKAFAESLACGGWNLILAALPSTGLDSVALGLSAVCGVDVIALELDLSTSEGQSRLLDTVKAEGRRLGLLVNNVGVGDNGLFDLMPLEGQRRSVDINVQTTMALTYGLVGRLAESGGKIINVASLAAFYPMPLFAVYAASKAFLLHWSLALRHELEPLGVGVTVLAPGGIYTNQETREKVRAQGFLGRLSCKEPEVVAEAALRGAFAGKPLVIPGFFNRILAVLGSLPPKNFTARAIYRRWRASLSRVGDSEESRWYYRRGERKAS
jgi:short-subunit dehydrogenase